MHGYQERKTFSSSPLHSTLSIGATISPMIVMDAFAQPKIYRGVFFCGVTGPSFATGLPCLVIVTSSPVSCTLSISSKHPALNFVAEITTEMTITLTTTQVKTNEETRGKGGVRRGHREERNFTTEAQRIRRFFRGWRFGVLGRTKRAGC